MGGLARRPAQAGNYLSIAANTRASSRALGAGARRLVSCPAGRHAVHAAWLLRRCCSRCEAACSARGSCGAACVLTTDGDRASRGSSSRGRGACRPGRGARHRLLYAGRWAARQPHGARTRTGSALGALAIAVVARRVRSGAGRPATLRQRWRSRARPWIIPPPSPRAGARRRAPRNGGPAVRPVAARCSRYDAAAARLLLAPWPSPWSSRWTPSARCVTQARHSGRHRADVGATCGRCGSERWRWGRGGRRRALARACVQRRPRPRSRSCVTVFAGVALATRPRLSAVRVTDSAAVRPGDAP